MLKSLLKFEVHIRIEKKFETEITFKWEIFFILKEYD